MARAERYNVVAAFPDTRRAQGAVRKLTNAGVSEDKVRLLRPDHDGGRDRRSSMRAEMQDEVAEAFAGPGIGLATPEQARGALVGVLIGVLAGAALGAGAGLLWIAFSDSSVPNLVRLLIAVIVFAIGGSTAGFIAGGALRPRMVAAQRDPRGQLDQHHLSGENEAVVAVHLRDPDAVDRAYRILSESGAERIDAVNADGTPLPPQSEHPRPADPPGRWWWPGRSKG